MKITTVDEFREALATPYVWPGGYPNYFLVDDGEALSFEAAEANKAQIEASIREKINDGWRIVAVETNYEDGALFCAHTNDRIPSSYAEPDS
jgi:hypothetical protein